MNKTTEIPYILIVDDNPENLLVLEKILNKFDVNIVKAKSGNEALAATLYNDFSMILLDVNMPDMDGYEVAELLNKDEKTSKIPIIFLTAMDQTDANIIKGYSKGAVDYIVKPINTTILNYKISVLLDLFLTKRSFDQYMTKKQTSKPQVLLVDDNPENLLALELILKNLDINIIKATSGNEALSSILYNDFALIILDVQMPEMDGYEVADILKSDPKTENIPIIFLTAIDRDEAKEVRGYNNGAVDFIFKPFNAYILLSKVKVFLELNIMKHSLENLADERYQLLLESNKNLKNEIMEHKETTIELIKAKSFLNSVLDSISFVIIAIDTDLKITGMNKEAERMSNTNIEEALGESCFKVFPYYKVFSEKISNAIISNEIIKEARIIIYINEKAFIVNFSAYPIVAETNNGAVAIIEDISERVKIDEVMIQSEKMLTIGGIATGMAQELKTPISGMIMPAQVIANRLGKEANNPANIDAAKEAKTSMEAIKKYADIRSIFKLLESIGDSGKKATELINNMLNFARKGQSTSAESNLIELMEKAINLAKNSLEPENELDFDKINVIRDFEKMVPPVNCEESKIIQVFLNLLINLMESLYFSKVQDPELIIKISYIKDLEMVEISLQDNGDGMEEDERKKIFDPFYKGKLPNKKSDPGLSVSNFIVTNNHSGKMSVESEPGNGTKFIIQLPVK